VNTIDNNKKYSIQKKIEAKEKKVTRSIEKHKVYLEWLKTRALQKSKDKLSSKYQRKHRSFEIKKQAELKSYEYTLWEKEIPKKYAKKPKGIDRYKKHAITEFQLYIRLSKSDEDWYCVMIDDPNIIRKYNWCDAGHIRPKYNYPHMIFYENNVRPQSKRDNKKQCDTVWYHLKEEVINRIWIDWWDNLERFANDKWLKTEAINRTLEYYIDQYEFYKYANDRLLEQKGFKR